MPKSYQAETLQEELLLMFNRHRRLIGDAVKYARHAGLGKTYRWAHVAEIFCVGMTSAIEMCREHGVRPFQQV